MGSCVSKAYVKTTFAPSISSGTVSSNFETQHLQDNNLNVFPIPSSLQDEVGQKTNPEEDAVSVGSEDEDSTLSEDQVLKDVENRLVELHQLERPWEVEGKRVLQFLLKKFNRNKKKSRLFEIAELLIKHKFLDVCVHIWDFCHSTEEENFGYLKSNSFYTMKLILWNYTDKCSNLAKAAFAQEELVERCMREFSMPELDVASLTHTRKRFLIKGTLGMLLNITRLHNPNHKLVRKGEGIPDLMKYYGSKYLIIKAKVMMLLAYCINEEENYKIVTGTGVIVFIIRLLGNALHSPNHIAKTYAFSATEIVMGLDKLAFNDSNKKSIVEAGILPFLSMMLAKDGSMEEIQAASHCLWTLSFHTENREMILKENGLLEAVHRILDDTNSDSETLRSCDGILFIVEGLEVQRNPNYFQQNQPVNQTKHIMISYQWDVQDIIFKVRDQLAERGFHVWLDVDKISGSILAAMADGIENAAVVVVAMTENYRNSNSCRTEAEYAYKLSKPVLPLLLQANYKPDGWLGALVGMQLYIDLSGPTALDVEKGEMLFQHVKSKLDGSSKTNMAKQSGNGTRSMKEKNVTSLQAAPTSTFLHQTEFSPKYSTWTTSEVAMWSSNIELGETKVFEDFDGIALSQLKKLLSRSPDVYYNALRNDFQLNWLQILQLTNALEKLD